MTKLDAGLITSLPASDPGSAAVWGSKRINPRRQFCLCLAWSGCPSNDDDDDDDEHLTRLTFMKLFNFGDFLWKTRWQHIFWYDLMTDHRLKLWLSAYFF